MIERKDALLVSPHPQTPRLGGFNRIFEHTAFISVVRVQGVSHYHTCPPGKGGSAFLFCFSCSAEFFSLTRKYICLFRNLGWFHEETGVNPFFIHSCHYFCAVWSGALLLPRRFYDFVDSKVAMGKTVTFGLHTSLKNCFILSLDVSERCTPDKSEAPGSLEVSRFFLFFLVFWNDIKSHLFERLWPHKGLTLKQQGLWFAHFRWPLNSFKLQKYHLVSYLFQGPTWHFKGLKY